MPKKTGKPSQTWMTFLRNHVGQMVSVDFFTVPTIQLRVLYVFFILAHDRRRVLHFNITENPTAAWTAQQILEAFPFDTAPRYLLRDRDGIYGLDFRARVDGLGIRQVPISARSPWQNCYKDAPESRPIQDLQAGRIIQIREVGGLHDRYERVTA